ncbi:MAG: metalloprotease [Flavobacteriaceae bacterium]
MTLLLLFGSHQLMTSQHQMKVNANFDPISKEITVEQEINYINNTSISIEVIYLNDWISSYSTSGTPLVKKFLNEYNTQLYIAKEKDRGRTEIESITTAEGDPIKFERHKDQQDFLKIILEQPLGQNEAISIQLKYVLKIQNARFTGYGFNKNGNFILNAWYLTPAVFDGLEWKLYSNLSFDDPYAAKSNVDLIVHTPPTYNVYSNLKRSELIKSNIGFQYHFSGQGVKDHKIHITNEDFKRIEIGSNEIVTNISHKTILAEKEREIISRVNAFLKQNLHTINEDKILLSKIDLKKNDLYGLALLPDFLSPFPKEFKYELAIAKNLIKIHLDQHLTIDPRTEYWLKNGFQMLLFLKYLDTYYPDQKLIGKLANIWGIKGYNFAKLNYNEQFRLTFYQMMRLGRDQALTTPKNKLLSFNERFTSYYKAAIALLYLKSYIKADNEILWIQEFIKIHNGNLTSTADFELYIKSKTSKDLDWFFDKFTRESLASDYKIKSVESVGDSLKLNIKNLRKGAYPVTLSFFENGHLMKSRWIEGFRGEKSITLADSTSNQLVLNYQNESPEFNLNNNWKSIGSYVFNKPLQLRFLRDYQNPNNYQLNIMPLTEFQNIYDGVKLGLNFNNRGILAKPVIFAIAPTYGLKSKTITGSAKVLFNKFHEDSELFKTMLGLTIDRASFDYGAFITKIQPFAQFTFRPQNDLRSNSLKRLQLRYINIQKDESRNPLDDNTIPPYQVFNVRYLSLDNNIADFKKWYIGLQFSENFGKINLNYEFRKRTPKDRHYNLRIFAGAFLYNTLLETETNFNYALDRPENYLFEYNYLGQSEDSGILAQQLLVAEGGFKSKLNPAYANQWITTLNASASIWRYIQAYSDVGFIKNKGNKPFFGYDSGIRMDLIIDYFELYFPVYSNLGWEISQANYSEKIRFVITTDISKLAGLFTRKWF